MQQRLAIRFIDSDRGAYEQHRWDWEQSLPRIPGELGRSWMLPTEDPDRVGWTIAGPVERAFIEFLRAKGFAFELAEIDVGNAA